MGVGRKSRAECDFLCCDRADAETDVADGFDKFHVGSLPQPLGKVIGSKFQSIKLAAVVRRLIVAAGEDETHTAVRSADTAKSVDDNVIFNQNQVRIFSRQFCGE